MFRSLTYNDSYDGRLYGSTRHALCSADFNNLFSQCHSLESVRFSLHREKAFEFIHGLNLPAQLQRLFIRASDMGMEYGPKPALLRDKNTKSFQLRSLQLWQHPTPTSHDYLKAGYSLLTHLSIQINHANVDSLTTALCSLPLLRAVELDGSGEGEEPFASWEMVVQALGSGCPELEHLKLDPWCPRIALSAESVLRLGQLVSLELEASSVGLLGNQDDIVDWSWLVALVEKGQLEHLELYMIEAPMPIELACKLIISCEVGLFWQLL